MTIGTTPQQLPIVMASAGGRRPKFRLLQQMDKLPIVFVAHVSLKPIPPIFSPFYAASSIQE